MLPQVRRPDLSVSVTHRGFECAVTGANLPRLTITVSPCRRSEATSAVAFTDAQTLEVVGSLGNNNGAAASV